MKIDPFFVSGMVFIAVLAGAAWFAATTGEFSYTLPVLILLLTGFPFILGFLAGRESK